MPPSHDTTTFVVPSPGRGESSACCLVMLLGPDMGKRIELQGPELTLGRDPSRDIAIDAPGVSRLHCRLLVSELGTSLVDLGSTNGSYVNGNRIAPNVALPLRPGDLIHVGGVIFKFLQGENVEAQYHDAAYQMMIVDALTQLKNRRYLMELLEREIARSLRHGRPLSLLLIDVDHFKQINDSLGHLAGDHLLRHLADILAKNTRREDCAARYGGDEFAVVMTETPLAGARVFAERLRSGAALLDYRDADREVCVTLSIGVAEVGPGQDSPERLIEAADRRLYEGAKSAGRDRVA